MTVTIVFSFDQSIYTLFRKIPLPDYKCIQGQLDINKGVFEYQLMWFFVIHSSYLFTKTDLKYRNIDECFTNDIKPYIKYP